MRLGIRTHLASNPLYQLAPYQAILNYDMQCSVSTYENLLEILRSWSVHNLADSPSLLYYVPILNKFDDIFRDFIEKHSSFISNTASSSTEEERIQYAVELELVKELLRWTTNLLKNAMDKAVYGSCEYIAIFLNGHDDELAEMALSLMTVLAMPVKSHRNVYDDQEESYGPPVDHTSAVLMSLYSIMMAADGFMSPTLDFFLSDSYCPPLHPATFSSSSSCRRSKSYRRFNHYELMKSMQHEDGEGAEDPGKMNFWEGRSKNHEPVVRWRRRFHRQMSSSQSRSNIIITLYRAFLTVAAFDEDADEIQRFFRDRLYYISGCLQLLGADYNKFPKIDRVSFDDMRLLACMSLGSFISKINAEYDEFDSPFQWIAQELGIAKGQYNGVLPSLLKTEITYLINISGEVDVERVDYDDDITRLLWIEELLTLVIHAVQTCSGLVALIDNGIVNHTLAVLKGNYHYMGKNPAHQQFIDLRLHVCSYLIQIQEMVIPMKPLAMDIFMSQNGIEVMLLRLEEMLTSCQEQPKVSQCRQIYILCLLHTVCWYFLKGKDSNCIHLQKSEQYRNIYTCFLTQSYKFNPALIAEVYHTLHACISNDPATPNLLIYFLEETTLIEESWRSIKHFMWNQNDEAIAVNGDMIGDLIDLISSVCLSTQGCEMVKKHNPFTTIFSVFYNTAHAMEPICRFLADNKTARLGSRVEELMRHNGEDLIDICLAAILDAMDKIVELGNEKVRHSHAIDDCSEDGGFLTVMTCAHSLLQVTDRILLRGPVVKKFIELNGIERCYKILSMQIRPEYCTLACLGQLHSTPISPFDNISQPLSCMDVTFNIFESLITIPTRSSSKNANIVIFLTFFRDKLKDLFISIKEEIKKYRENYWSWESGHHALFEYMKQRGLDISNEPIDSYKDDLFHGLTDTVSSKCLDVNTRNFDMNDKSLLYTSILHKGVLLSKCLFFICETVWEIDNNSVFDVFMRDEAGLEFVNELLSTFYLSAIRAQCADNFLLYRSSDFPSSHPVYRVLVIARSVNVFEEPSLHSKRVCKLSAMSSYDTFDRMETKDGNIFYRLEIGWCNDRDKDGFPNLEVIELRPQTPSENVRWSRRLNGLSHQEKKKQLGLLGFCNLRSFGSSMIHLLVSSISSFNMKLIQTIGIKSQVPRGLAKYSKPMNDGILWILAHLSSVNIVLENNISEATKCWRFSALTSDRDDFAFRSLNYTELVFFVRLSMMVLFPHGDDSTSSIAGMLNVHMLRLFYDHGILQKLLDYSVILVRSYLQAVHEKLHRTEIDKGINVYEGYDWEELTNNPSYSLIVQKAVSHVRSDAGDHGLNALVEHWNRVLSKLNDTWGFSQEEKILRENSIFMIVNSLWEMFYYDELYLLHHATCSLVRLAERCRTALESCLETDVDGYAGQKRKSPKNIPGKSKKSPSKKGKSMQMEIDAFLEYGGMNEDEFDTLLNMGFDHAKILKACDKCDSRTLGSILDFLVDANNQDYLQTCATTIQPEMQDSELRQESSAVTDAAIKPSGKGKRRITVFNVKNSQKKDDRNNVTNNCSDTKSDENRKQHIEILLEKLSFVILKMISVLLCRDPNLQGEEYLPHMTQGKDFYNGLMLENTWLSGKNSIAVDGSEDKFCIRGKLQIFMFLMSFIRERDIDEKGLYFPVDDEPIQLLTGLIQLFNSKLHVDGKVIMICLMNYHPYFKEIVISILKYLHHLKPDDLLKSKQAAQCLLIMDYVYFQSFYETTDYYSFEEELGHLVEVSGQFPGVSKDTFKAISDETCILWNQRIPGLFCPDENITNELLVVIIRALNGAPTICKDFTKLCTPLVSILYLTVHIPRSSPFLHLLENKEALINWLSYIPLCLRNYSSQIISVVQSMSLHENMQFHIQNNIEAFVGSGIKYHKLTPTTPRNYQDEFFAMGPIFFREPRCFLRIFQSSHSKEDHLIFEQKLDIERCLFNAFNVHLDGISSWIHEAKQDMDERVAEFLFMLGDSFQIIPGIMRFMCNKESTFIQRTISDVFTSIIIEASCLRSNSKWNRCRRSSCAVFYLMTSLCTADSTSLELVMTALKSVVDGILEGGRVPSDEQLEIIFAVSNFFYLFGNEGFLPVIHDILSEWNTRDVFSVTAQMKKYILAGAAYTGLHTSFANVLSVLPKTNALTLDVQEAISKAMYNILSDGIEFALTTYKARKDIDGNMLFSTNNECDKLHLETLRHGVLAKNVSHYLRTQLPAQPESYHESYYREQSSFRVDEYDDDDSDDDENGGNNSSSKADDDYSENDECVCDDDGDDDDDNDDGDDDGDDDDDDDDDGNIEQDDDSNDDNNSNYEEEDGDLEDGDSEDGDNSTVYEEDNSGECSDSNVDRESIPTFHFHSNSPFRGAIGRFRDWGSDGDDDDESEEVGGRDDEDEDENEETDEEEDGEEEDSDDDEDDEDNGDWSDDDFESDGSSSSSDDSEIIGEDVGNIIAPSATFTKFWSSKFNKTVQTENSQIDMQHDSETSYSTGLRHPLVFIRNFFDDYNAWREKIICEYKKEWYSHSHDFVKPRRHGTDLGIFLPYMPPNMSGMKWFEVQEITNVENDEDKLSVQESVETSMDALVSETSRAQRFDSQPMSVTKWANKDHSVSDNYIDGRKERIEEFTHLISHILEHSLELVPEFPTPMQLTWIPVATVFISYLLDSSLPTVPSMNKLMILFQMFHKSQYSASFLNMMTRAMENGSSKDLLQEFKTYTTDHYSPHLTSLGRTTLSHAIQLLETNCTMAEFADVPKTFYSLHKIILTLAYFITDYRVEGSSFKRCTEKDKVESFQPPDVVKCWFLGPVLLCKTLKEVCSFKLPTDIVVQNLLLKYINSPACTTSKELVIVLKIVSFSIEKLVSYSSRSKTAPCHIEIDHSSLTNITDLCLRSDIMSNSALKYLSRIVEVLTGEFSLVRAATVAQLKEVIMSTVDPVLEELNKSQVMLENTIDVFESCTDADINSLYTEKCQYNLDFPAVSATMQPLMHALRLLSVCKKAMTNDEISDVSSNLSSNSKFVTLWNTLINCLVILRRFRGANKSDTSSTITSTQSLNSIEIQLVPMIKCFMEICTLTLIENSDNTSLPRNEISTPLQRSDSVEQRRQNMEDHNCFIRKQLEDSPLSRKLIKFTEENSMLINAVLRQNIKLLKGSLLPMLVVPSCRRHLDFRVKRTYLRFQLRNMSKKCEEMRDNMSVEDEDDYLDDLEIEVSRDDILQSSFEALYNKKEHQLRRTTCVTFRGEEGVDGGGLTREWYQILTRDLFSPKFNLFHSINVTNPMYQPSESSGINSRHLEYFKFAGVIVAKAICDDELLDVHFSRSFYKHILGLPITFQDLETVDSSFYKSLKMILDNSLTDLGIDLTFSIEQNIFGKTDVVDLKENGRNIAVTDMNKEEYVNLVANHKMSSSLKDQITAFVDGFYSLITPDLVSIFDPQQLELMICGLPDIDMDDLRAHTTYQNYKTSDVQIKYLWNVLRAFSKEEKALFLQFVTGTSKVPLDGFRALQGSDGVKYFNVHKAYDSELLPTAHTCFNQLDLPEYESEAVLREKLLIAIREGSEGFGFA